MKYHRVLAGILCCLIPAVAYARPYTLTWNAMAGATSYRLYQSTDQGASWTKVYDGASNQATVDVTGTTLVLFRASAINSVGEAIRTDAGAWVDPSKQPAGAGLGVQ